MTTKPGPDTELHCEWIHSELVDLFIGSRVNQMAMSHNQ
jgi:hypothetical protein